MGVFTSFMQSSDNINGDFIRINGNKGKIDGHMWAFKYIDKDTKQAIIYVPSFEISGYGETFDKAENILKFNLDQLFDYLSELSMQEIDTELSKLGWSKGVFSKQYSRVFIDINGELKNLNAEDNKVEIATLTAA